MRVGRRSKAVAFVAILALLTFGALATASAQPADIKAIDKAFQDHYARGNYPAAQIEARELERLAKTRFGADHPHYAVALNKLGIVYRTQGKYSEAEDFLKRALVIREKALGASDPDVGQTLTNLANVFRDQAKYGEAEGLFKRALVIREKALGATHSDVGQTLNNLALVHKRALAMYEKAHGVNHPNCGSGSSQSGHGLWDPRRQSLLLARRPSVAKLKDDSATATGCSALMTARMIRCANGGVAKSSERPICGSCSFLGDTPVARNWLILLTLVRLTLWGGIAWTATNVAVAQPQDLNAIYSQFEEQYQARSLRRGGAVGQASARSLRGALWARPS
jgi:tetratricopeptide (TPR) repeat protein